MPMPDPGEPGPRHQGLVLDFGGVLTTSMRTNAELFEQAEGIPRGAYRRALRHPDGVRVYRDLEEGRATQQEWNDVIGGLLGLPADDLMRRVLHRLRPEPAVLAAVRRARARGVWTAMLSNSFGLEPYNVYRDLDVLGLFDVVVLSELEGLRKPESEIYRRTCRRLGLAAEHLLFVDDHEVNLAPAEKLGMATLLHTDADVTAGHLDALFGPRKELISRTG
ncbi:HAD-IA family hydrolase [Streptomyces sp. NPDC005374]|uniref:HAD-IA family hydrolase n=1 Tax=Streptomyces sp. NPDC005374 TaxID=3364713 RepID=UPI0036ABFCDB